MCIHIPHSRADLYNIIAIKRLKTFVDVMKAVGKNPDSLGCELCKPAIASILASLFNQHIMDKEVHELQDTNDRFLANIQRNGMLYVVLIHHGLISVTRDLFGCTPYSCWGGQIWSHHFACPFRLTPCSVSDNAG